MSNAGINWDGLVQSIQDGEAVLVLGPDAIPFYSAVSTTDYEEMTFAQRVQLQVINSLGDDISYHYKRDNLFQFKSPSAKQSALKEVRSVARSTDWHPDKELLRQLVSMPFPVILNISPDKTIYDAFIAYYKEPQFDYFTTKDKPNPTKLTYPDGLNQPIIYNLCGSVLDKLDSVVLDYNDLLDLIKNLLMDNGVPQQLIRKLQEADRFILLGFELERWYFQLLLHYLNKLESSYFNNPNLNFPILANVSEDTKEFVMNQFNIKHIATSRYEFELLYKACEARGILRDINEGGSPTESTARAYLGAGRFEELFTLLEGLISNPDLKIELAHLKGRYYSCIEKKRNEEVSDTDYSQEINRIKYSLITFSSQIHTS
ncbi:MAG: hypothetical protein JNN28_04405 [Saprospiraceae bacterium]|nr:hypothetical protein [Saprospiraceae bacterium]